MDVRVNQPRIAANSRAVLALPHLIARKSLASGDFLLSYSFHGEKARRMKGNRWTRTAHEAHAPYTAARKSFFVGDHVEFPGVSTM